MCQYKYRSSKVLMVFSWTVQGPNDLGLERNRRNILGIWMTQETFLAYIWHKRLPPGAGALHPHRQHHLVGFIVIQALQGSLPWQSKQRKQLCAREQGLNHSLDSGNNWIKVRRWMWEGLSKARCCPGHPSWLLPASLHALEPHRCSQNVHLHQCQPHWKRNRETPFWCGATSPHNCLLFKACFHTANLWESLLGC